MPTGAGGGGSPKGWPLNNFVIGSSSAGAALGTANTLWVESFNLPYQLTFAHININITVADGAGLYDFGLYTFAGSLVANLGAQHLPSTGEQNLATVQGAQTISPGVYFAAFTGNGTTAQIAFYNGLWSWYSSRSTGTSVGGALPASFTPPGAALDTITWFFILN